MENQEKNAAEVNPKKQIAAPKKKQAPSCETCAFYDYDEEYDEYYCRVNMDQDDMARLGSSSRAVCPFYRLYDEYKSVRKQN